MLQGIIRRLGLGPDAIHPIEARATGAAFARGAAGRSAKGPIAAVAGLSRSLHRARPRV